MASHLGYLWEGGGAPAGLRGDPAWPACERNNVGDYAAGCVASRWPGEIGLFIPWCKTSRRRLNFQRRKCFQNEMDFWLQEQNFKQVAKTSWDRSQHRSFHRKLQYSLRFGK
jgi:hypothetical protein